MCFPFTFTFICAKKLSHLMELRSTQSPIDKFFVVAELGLQCIWHPGNWKANRNWMDKLGLDFEKCKILFKKSSPQVSEFFSVCLVRPTCTHRRRHWTRRSSPKGDRKIIGTLILQRYVFFLKWPKRSTFQYELWIWRICPPDRYCVCGRKIENIVKVSTSFAKTEIWPKLWN